MSSGGSGFGGSTINVPMTPIPTDPNGCKPLSCHPEGGDYCGEVGDGCSGKMNCGACPKSDWICDKGVCKGPASCQRRTSCTEGQAKYCGSVGDGCGGELDCGGCTAPATCGGTGVAHVCGDPACVPVSCALRVGQYCGTVGDGCGHSLNCGDCPGNAQCGGDGIPNVCPGSQGATMCEGIRCNVETCSNGGTTSLSGVVYDPAGENPLYNVRVYVPNKPLDDIPTGATCEQCNANLSGEPITATITDASGKFKLENVPSGSNIPLVMQVGRWRRQVTIPNVQGCSDNPISDRNLTRLPRNQKEGHIPLIAITTGESDALECLIPRIGLDRSEVTTDSGGGRVHLYAGGNPGAMGTGRGAIQLDSGEMLPHASTLWSDRTKMRGYDIVMYSCEGAENRPPKDDYLANFEDYINNGGRAFLTHFHYYWLSHGSDKLRGTATYTDAGGNLPSPSTGIINTGFPKGAALADWLMVTGASTVRGELPIYEGRNSVTRAIAPTQDWISVPAKPALQYMTFNTPIGTPAEQQCGRVVFTDLHVAALVGRPAGVPGGPGPGMGFGGRGGGGASGQGGAPGQGGASNSGNSGGTGGVIQGGDDSAPTIPYPRGCSMNPMSPQAKALEFIFFDLAACVQPDTQKPSPPPPPPPTQVPPPVVPVPPPPPPPPPL